MRRKHKNKQNQDSYRGLLSEWERKIIKAEDAIPQHRYRVRNRLKKALDKLPLELTEILFSNALYGFNLRNLIKWQNLKEALDHSLQHLFRPVEFEYPVIADVEGRWYTSKMEKFRYKPGQLIGDALELEKDEDVQ